MITIPKHLKKVRQITRTKEELEGFELKVKEEWDSAHILGPIHLSKGNEAQLIEIFQYVHPEDWVFSTWRNHLHAILHGIPDDWVLDQCLKGRSMKMMSDEHRFVTSAIVGGIIPIAVGTAMALKMKKSERRVWCFVGDMTFETGGFHEAYKYCKNFDLPIQFVVEDNNLSTNTPTDKTWGRKQSVPEDVIYYAYERGYPHHGSGAWVLF